MIVSGSGNEEQIAKDLYILFIAVGIYTSALLIIIIFCKFVLI